ncbi:MAG TPA: type II secretion system protein [Verrucomicrobiae bacterium]|nr:type II secretion system protein [Verrucomicrobiae bacterium]
MKRAAGFTLTELVVLIVVGAVLSGVLLADLNQSRTTLLRQACAANLKQWGMAIYLYAQDYNGTYYYSFMASNFSDTDSPYFRYLGGNDRVATMRTMRLCPAVAARNMPENPAASALHSYSMPVAMQYLGGAYIRTSPQPGDGFWGFNLRSVPYPSQYLLMIDSRGNTLTCGGLVSAVTQINTSSGDTIPAMNRHGAGSVNCLFGDLHVDNVSTQTLHQVDAISCPHGNPWFMMN